MNRPAPSLAGPDSWPSVAEWSVLVDRMERATAVRTTDPATALKLVTETEHDLIGDPQAQAADRLGVLDRALRAAVAEARRQGLSWTEIAHATHTTRQAAWRRWSSQGIN